MVAVACARRVFPSTRITAVAREICRATLDGRRDRAPRSADTRQTRGDNYDAGGWRTLSAPRGEKSAVITLIVRPATTMRRRGEEEEEGGREICAASLNRLSAPRAENISWSLREDRALARAITCFKERTRNSVPGRGRGEHRCCHSRGKCATRLPQI